MAKYWNRKYWLIRLRKLKGSPNSIAIGVACGVSVSFTPFVGAHLVLAMILAWCLRGNILAAVLGTAFGNPWTFPFIWISVLYTGRKILGTGYDGITDVDFQSFFSQAFNALINLNIERFVGDLWPVLYPMMIGAIPYFLISWILSYVIVRSVLIKRSKYVKREA